MTDKLHVASSELDALISAQLDPEPYSGVVRISRTDRPEAPPLYEARQGLRHRPEQLPILPDTRFQMASGCKVFTALAVLQLAQAGIISLDDTIWQTIGRRFPNADPEVTVGQLLGHTSGITSYFEEDVNDDYEALWQALPVYRVRRPADYLPLFEDKPQKFDPGSRFEYNDGGYILLGLVVEAGTGQKFTDYVIEHVFAPAGMTASDYPSSDNLPANTARAYIPMPDGTWRTNVFAVPSVGGADGGAYTTGLDMARFWTALLQNRLLAADWTARMLAPQAATGWKSPHTHYGMGMWIDQPEGREVQKVFVEGMDPGVALRSVVYPQKGLTLTMLANTQNALWPLFRKIDALLDA